MLVDRTLPGQKLVHRQLITIAGFLDTEEATAHGRYDLRLAADDPTLRVTGWKISHSQRTPIGSDNVAYSRSHLMFGHDTQYNY